MRKFSWTIPQWLRNRIPTLRCLILAPVALTFLPVAAGVTIALVATAVIWVNEIVRLQDAEDAQEARWASKDNAPAPLDSAE